MVKMTRSKTFQAYLPSCHRTYSCIHCRAHLANHDELISKQPFCSALEHRCLNTTLERAFKRNIAALPTKGASAFLKRMIVKGLVTEKKGHFFDLQRVPRAKWRARIKICCKCNY
ncbi:uncharacterized protein ypel2a isoform X3 [Stegostoma tigrinum]|uniref:uncharacterized protein ypel2a isoform X3 n=1 Tax=Stegostoma tigrinum TaxID=3053191 RepID=UPI00202BA298|nr:uncharacterized protein ypel2a isoform X3 [Stegostoma tigrinum]